MKALILLACISCVGCAEALPPAHSAVDFAKDALKRAPAIYNSVCVPPLVPQMSEPCTRLGKALESADPVLASVEISLAAVEAVSK